MEEPRDRFWEKELGSGRLEVLKMRASAAVRPKAYYRVFWFREGRRTHIGDMGADRRYVPSEREAGAHMEPGIGEALDELRDVVEVDHVMES